jgi:metal-dependent amidase/aminoacylase/carboxypeptidase family protein
MSQSKQIARDWINENSNRLIEISDAIWEYAELGFVEFKSRALPSDAKPPIHQWT